MHAWFAVHQIHPAVVEVKGLHQFGLSAIHGQSVVETIKEVRLSKSLYSQYGGADWDIRWLESLKPSTYSVLNYLKIHLPEVSFFLSFIVITISTTGGNQPNNLVFFFLLIPQMVGVI
jgi:hypothetical protein